MAIIIHTNWNTKPPAQRIDMLNGMGEGENQGILNACHKLNYFSRQNPNPEVLK